MNGQKTPTEECPSRIQLTTRQGNLNTNSWPYSDRLQPYSPLYEWNQPTKRKDCHFSPHCYFLPKLCNLFTTIQIDISAKINILTHVIPAGRDRTQNNSHEHTDSFDPGWPWQDSKQLTWTHQLHMEPSCHHTQTCQRWTKITSFRNTPTRQWDEGVWWLWSV